MEVVDRQASYRALQTRDARFDGRLFVAVTSTGIYCRPVCPARPPKLEHCRFYPSAAAAQDAGFRPCLRCRPETAPDSGSWRGTSSTVSRGLALIAQGALDGDGASVEALAERLGVGDRHLRRLFQEHLGVSPIAVAQTRRILFAKQLIHDTALPMAEIALASGFGSIRRFNETFQLLFGRPPSALRRVLGRPGAETAVTLRLSYRPPYDWPAMLAYLQGRAVDGVEQVVGEVYRRTLLEDGHAGFVEIAHLGAAHSLAATIHVSSVAALPKIVARVRRLFDLGADVEMIARQLAHDPLLSPLLAARPGLRVAGAWDGFELAARAVLGQQVTVEAGRRLTSRLAQICGASLATTGGLSRSFPTARQVLDADLAALPVPRARRAALLAVARAASDDPHLFEPLETVEQTVARLSTIAGVGAWTAHYIAMRAAHEPDALPDSDAALLRSVAVLAGDRPTPARLRERAEAWRPWRAYAAAHLWASDASTTPARISS